MVPTIDSRPTPVGALVVVLQPLAANSFWSLKEGGNSVVAGSAGKQFATHVYTLDPQNAWENSFRSSWIVVVSGGF